MNAALFGRVCAWCIKASVGVMVISWSPIADMRQPDWGGCATALFQSRENGCNRRRANKQTAKTRRNRPSALPLKNSGKSLRISAQSGSVRTAVTLLRVNLPELMDTCSRLEEPGGVGWKDVNGDRLRRIISGKRSILWLRAAARLGRLPRSL